MQYAHCTSPNSLPFIPELFLILSQAYYAQIIPGIIFSSLMRGSDHKQLTVHNQSQTIIQGPQSKLSRAVFPKCPEKESRKSVGE